MNTLLLAVAADSLAIVTAALAVVVLLARRSAALRHLVLAAAFLAIALVPAFELLLPSWSVRTSAPAVVAEIAMGDAPPVVEPAIRSEAVPATAPARAMDSVRVIDWPRVLLGIWIAGTAATSAVLIAALLRVRRVGRRASGRPDPNAAHLLGEARRLLQVRREVRVLHADRVPPVTWGVSRPVVLLPEAARGWSDERLRLVILHELAHVRRGDWIWLLLAAVICCTQWFNPLLWIAERRLRRESECAADDLVLHAGIAAPDYADHLLALAREAVRLQPLSLAATPVVQPSTLHERIQIMLNDTLDRRPLTARARTAAVAAVLLAAAIIAAAGTTRAASPAMHQRDDVTLPAAASGHTENAPARIGTAAPVIPSAPPARSAAVTVTQPLPATLIGALYDQHSGLLPGADVVLTAANGDSLTATSDGEGAFRFDSLAPGTYTLVTSLRGFAPVRNVVTLVDGGTLRRNIVLPLGTVEEHITVASDGTVSRAAPPRSLSREIPEPKVPTPCVGRVGGCIKAPTKALDVKPVYPAELAAAGVGAIVRLSGRIGIDGYVSDLKHLGSEGSDSSAFNPAFVAAAMNAVQLWEFNPTLLNGAPVEASMTITVVFRPVAAR